MDVNGVPYLALMERSELLPEGAGFAWNADDRHLCLARADEPRVPTRDLAAQRRPAPAVAVDPFGQVASIGAAQGTRASERWVEVTLDAGLVSERREPLRLGYRVTTDAQGHELQNIPADDEDAVVVPPGAATYRDLALAAGLLALPSSDGIDSTLQVYDLRQRRLLEAPLPAVPRRVAVAQNGRIWVLAADRLLAVAGGPLPQPFTPAPDVFRPERDNPVPLGVVAELALPAGLRGVALSVAPEKLWVLCEDVVGDQVLLLLGPAGQFVRFSLPVELPWFADLAPIGDALAFLAWPAPGDPPRRDAWLATAETQPTPRLLPRAGRHPLHPLASPRFSTPSASGPRYSSDRGPALLALLPQPQFVTRASGTLAQLLDSGEVGCIWHRLVLEGSIAEGCAVRCEVRASELPFTDEISGWLEQPPLGWVPSSDLPWHAGLVPAQPQYAGHFELLLQRPSGNVRRIGGRFLQLRLTLIGDGRHSPSIAAIRVHYRRFSYQEQHLPVVFRQQEALEPSSSVANGADVRERFFAALEGMLTPIEGRIAFAEWLVDPMSAPRSLLPQIARFTGIELDPSWPEARSRRLLAESGRLHRLRGTKQGVQLALDIATDGAVKRGQIVIVENYRLRRTMATLLGVRIDDRDHPLTLGTMPEGNSIVGDSLILAEASARAYLALLDDRGQSDAAAVARFFDTYAHQVTLLLHGAARSASAAVEGALARFAPAQVRFRIIATDTPFVLGLSPLLSIDTAVEVEPPAEAVTLGATLLGRGDLVQNGASFIPSATSH